MAATFVSIDFYSVLDLGRDATTQEINAAYKKLALKYHPDKGGDQHLEKFRLIKEAAEVLRDPRRRLEYDQSNSHEHPRYNQSSQYQQHSRRQSRRKNRYNQEDDWHNWGQQQPTTWRNVDLNSNLKNADDCYKYSYGSSVHMDPFSEESMAESARISAEADKWAAEYAAMQAAYEAELKAEQEAAEQAEYETNSNNSDTEEAVEANPTTEYNASGEFHSPGLFSDYIDGVQHESGFYYNHSSELNEDEDEDAGCKIWTDEDGSFTKEFNSFVNENRGPPQRVETATEPLEPLCEYFNTKLSDSDDLYRFSDMIMEVNGRLFW